MDATELRAMQAPIKERYKSDPDAAVITLKAKGSIENEGIACKVETGRALAVAGLHPATGGSGLELCSGDMLLEALVACAGVTLKSVATADRSAAEAAAMSSAEGDLDFRGTLGVDKEAPVGFAEIRLRFEVDTDAPQDKLDQLLKLTERYCVVYQTIRNGPKVVGVDEAGVRYAPPSSRRTPGRIRRELSTRETARVETTLLAIRNTLRLWIPAAFTAGTTDRAMSPEFIFFLTLGLRMAITAAFVVTASIITERSGPVIGALVATLPISAGPSYVFLALDHDAAFIAEGALASLPINAATIYLGLTYVVLAQRHGALRQRGRGGHGLDRARCHHPLSFSGRSPAG